MQVFLVLETCFLLKLHFKQILKHKKNTVKFTRERKRWRDSMVTLNLVLTDIESYRQKYIFIFRNMVSMSWYGHYELSLDRFFVIDSDNSKVVKHFELPVLSTKNHDHWLAEMSGSSIYVCAWSTYNDMIILDFCRAFEKVPYKRV